jgi:hypothetical protein
MLINEYSLLALNPNLFVKYNLLCLKQIVTFQSDKLKKLSQ